MSSIKNLLVAIFCCYMIAACGSEKNKEGSKSGKATEKSGGVEEGEAATTDKVKTSTGKKPLAGLGSLLGGGKKKAAAKKSSLFGGLGMGNILGGIKAAPLGAKPDVAAPVGKTPVPVAIKDVPPPVAVEPPAMPVAVSDACKKFASHVVGIAKKEIGAQLAEAKKAGIDMGGNLEKMIQEMGPMLEQVCEQQKLPQEIHTCVLAATDMASLEKCDSSGGGGDDVDMDDIAEDWEMDMPEDMADMPTEVEVSGDAECDQIAAQLITVLLKTLSPEEAKQMEPMKVMLQNEISKDCAKRPWPKNARECVRKARSEADIEKCGELMGE